MSRKVVNAEWLRVGRNSNCELHLPDPRVALAQGLIADRGGLVYLEGKAGARDITSQSVRAVRLAPGKPIEIGPYRVEGRAPPPGFDAAIAVELLRPLDEVADLRARTTRVTLASHLPSKRAMAWTLAIIVLALCLAIPAGRVLHLPWRQVAAETPAGDRMWNPGPLMLAHQPIEQRCAACHQAAFQRVRDGACLECHRTTGQHVGADLQKAVALDTARCATCHRDHKGVRAVFRDDDRLCIECHASLHARVPGTGAGDASDFGTAHPAFRISLGAAPEAVRVRQQAGTPMKQSTNLRFPHATHLDPKGVRSPDRGRVVLDCSGCHHPDASRRGFEPIAMARDCQACHRLRFEPAVTTREVPHGKPADAATVIEEFYANLALKGTPDSFRKAFGVPGEGLVRRAGGAGDAEREDALRMAGVKAARVARELFEVRVCNTCHAVSRDPSAAPRLAHRPGGRHEALDAPCAVRPSRARSARNAPTATTSRDRRMRATWRCPPSRRAACATPGPHPRRARSPRTACCATPSTTRPIPGSRPPRRGSPVRR